MIRWQCLIVNELTGEHVFCEVAAQHPDDARHAALAWAFKEMAWRKCSCVPPVALGKDDET